MRRHIHYEVAFEDYLRVSNIPYVAVDEHRQAIFSGARVKSFDFLVYRQQGCTWLVDIKGRKFPYVGHDGQKHYWENWVTRDDLDGLERWQRVFGPDFEGQLVFAYAVTDFARAPAGTLHIFRGVHYAFLGIPVTRYREAARTRSGSWDTLSMPAGTFRRLARPVQELLSAPAFTGGRAGV